MTPSETRSRARARSAAGAGREARLLGLAYELEEAVGWPRIQGPQQALEQGSEAVS